jgi:hypothetical protein
MYRRISELYRWPQTFLGISDRNYEGGETVGPD